MAGAGGKAKLPNSQCISPPPQFAPHVRRVTFMHMTRASGAVSRVARCIHRLPMHMRARATARR